MPAHPERDNPSSGPRASSAAVADHAAAVEAERLGARTAAEQLASDRWRVLIDPGGHPFCRTPQIPVVRVGSRGAGVWGRSPSGHDERVAWRR